MIENTAKAKRVQAGLVVLTILMAVMLRFGQLGEWPGFEYDEGTAAIQARLMADGELFTLLGEKVYRGPVLEYLIVPFLWLGLPIALASRLPVALVSLFGLFGVWRLLRRWYPVVVALLWVGGLAAHPWFLATSRVAHSMSLVPWWLFLAFERLLAAADPGSHPRRAPLLSGVFLGLAFQGHLYTGMLLPMFAVWLFLRGGRWGWLALGWLIGAGPLLVGNVVQPLISLRIFLTGHEGHLVGTGGASYLQRLVGHLYGLLQVGCGPAWWLDVRPVLTDLGVPVIARLGGVLLGLALFGGVAWGLWRGLTGQREEHGAPPAPPLGLLTVWVVSAALIVPLVTKHRVWETALGTMYPSLPTYYDLLLPGVVLLAMLGPVVAPGKLPVYGLMFAMLFSGGSSFLKRTMVVPYATGWGRWAVPWTRIEKLVARHAPQHDLLSSSAAFGGVAPQLRAAFPELPFHGYYYFPTGFYDEHGGLRHVRVLNVERNSVAQVRRLGCLEPTGPVGPEDAKPWCVSSYRSPGLGIRISTPQLQLGLLAVSDGNILVVQEGQIVLGEQGGSTTWRISSVERTDRRSWRQVSVPVEFLGPADLDPTPFLSWQLEEMLLSGSATAADEPGASEVRWELRLLAPLTQERRVSFVLAGHAEQRDLPVERLLVY